ncbi:hypothetical protein EI427_08905 [Flammeovirga pectinis]|uniref:Uncharacterized protein n=1 Tax=Flammeovirga pectinis TaxID=2494373 RepID=A0A3Q9FQC8_9BACT|nr:hypothetical protein [Flammeovirga pectinis]AZQ62354.1 hypothetical protein EI427_08905 [Flammeovirga pectinis]
MSKNKKRQSIKKEVAVCNTFKWQHLFLYGFRLEKSKCPECKKQPNFSDRQKMFIDLGFGFIFAALFVTLPNIMSIFGFDLGQLGSFLIEVIVVLIIRESLIKLWPTKK